MDKDVVSPKELTIDEGKLLVRIARKAIKEYLLSGSIVNVEEVPAKLLKKGMCFVTILKYPSNELRGCIGFTAPIEPLVKNVVNAAIAAATEDPRFPPLSLSELSNVIIEVSVLSSAEPLTTTGRDRVSQVVIGEHGLIVEYGFYKGLLLPEVPIEYCWDTETFLSETCIKAGLPPDCWLSDKVKVFRFTAKTFRELQPEGDIIERSLIKEYQERCVA